MHNGFSPSRRAWNRVMTVLVWAAALLVMALVAGILGMVLVRGVPHISWNPLYPGGSRADFGGTVLAAVQPGEECYFIHSYEAKPTDETDCLAFTVYGGRRICAAATHGSVLGCQFHPEFKSRPDRPHPLFRGFVAAALAQQ